MTANDRILRPSTARQPAKPASADQLRGSNALVVGLGRSGRAAARLLRRAGALASPPSTRVGPTLETWAAVVAELRARAGRLRRGRPRPGGRLARACRSRTPISSRAPGRRRPGRGRGRAGLAGSSTQPDGRHHRHQRQEHHHRALRRDAARRGPADLRRRQPRARRSARPWAAPGTRWSSSSPASSSRASRAFRARVAAFLNLTPDHLDRYPSLDAYAAAKARLFENQRVGRRGGPERRDPRLGPDGRRRDGAPLGLRRPPSGPPPSARPARRRLRARLSARAAASATGSPTGPCAATTTSRTPWRPRSARGRSGVSAGRGAGGARRLPRPAAPARVVRERARRRVGQRLEGHQRRLHGRRARGRCPGPLWWIAGGRGKGAPYAPLRPLLAGRTRGCS